MNYAGVQAHIDRGRGIAALHVGQPYDVYRIAANGAVNYLDALNKIASVPVLRRLIGGTKAGLEASPLIQLLFEVVGDMSHFELGDVFIQNDPAYGAGATSVTYETEQFNGFVLASHVPVKKSLGGRVNYLGTVARPNAGVDANNYYSADPCAGDVLSLVDGVFALGVADAPAAAIPVGVETEKRIRGDLFNDIPTTTREVFFVMYVPPLPGFTFREGDYVILQDGSRYVVQNPYEQQAGFVGSQLVVQREAPQSTS